MPACSSTIDGFITDKVNGESLAFGNVILRGSALGSSTNVDGYYAIQDIPPGRHQVSFSYIGYEPLVLEATVHPNRTTRLNAELTPGTVWLAETIVEADRDEEERLVQTSFLSLDSQQLRELPAVGETDILRALQLLPGIQAASDISSGLYVRGSGPDQTLILLDQIPLYNPSHAFGFFSTFNADAIKDMSLHKGAYPAEYGGRLGSVLDVRNRDGNRNQVAGKGGLSLIASRLTLEGPLSHGSWLISGRRTYLEPMLSAMRASGTDVPSYYFYDLNAKLNRDFGHDNKVSMSGYFGRDDLAFNFSADSFIQIRWGNTAVTSKWTHVFTPAVFGNFVLSWSEYFTTTSLSLFETPIEFSSDVRDASLKADVDFFASSHHTFTAGLLASLYEFGYRQRFNHEDQVDVRLEPSLLGIYLQDKWQLSLDTIVRYGLRTSYFTEGRRLHVEPRISMSHALNDKFRLKFAGGSYHQYLQLITTEGFGGGDIWVPLDSSVEPGESWQIAGGGEWEPDPAWQITAEAYYARQKNLVSVDNNVAADSADDQNTSEEIFISGGSGYSTGLELFAQKRTGSLTGWVGYGLGWTRRLFDELNQGIEFAPKYDRRHDLSLVLTYRTGKWTFGINQIYATGQAFTPAAERYTLRNPATGNPPPSGLLLPAPKNSARLLPYHRMDLSIKRDFSLLGVQADGFIQLFNAYNRRNEWFVQYDTSDIETEPSVVKMLPIVPTLGINFGF